MNSRAQSIASVLLENEDELDPKAFVMGRVSRNDVDWQGHNFAERMPVGGIRRKGRGHDKQCEFHYKNWMFTVSTYENGETLWSAYYKQPVFSWSTKNEQREGFSWGGGTDITRVPARYSLKYYLKKLKQMADEHPDPWRARNAPRMPKP